MSTFNAIYDKLTDGTIGQWLAIIGVLSLIYWGWRIFVALQHHQSNMPPVTAAPAMQSAAPSTSRLGTFDEDIAVIAAAVAAVMGPHRIVHLEPGGTEQTWAMEGRWMQQTSHKPR